MGEYVHAEMLFHAKALELYTTAFRSLQGISEDEAAQVNGPNTHNTALYGKPLYHSQYIQYHITATCSDLCILTTYRSKSF